MNSLKPVEVMKGGLDHFSFYRKEDHFVIPCPKTHSRYYDLKKGASMKNLLGSETSLRLKKLEDNQGTLGKIIELSSKELRLDGRLKMAFQSKLDELEKNGIDLRVNQELHSR